jgi:hypothetical protein
VVNGLSLSYSGVLKGFAVAQKFAVRTCAVLYRFVGARSVTNLNSNAFRSLTQCCQQRHNAPVALLQLGTRVRSTTRTVLLGKIALVRMYMPFVESPRHLVILNISRKYTCQPVCLLCGLSRVELRTEGRSFRSGVGYRAPSHRLYIAEPQVHCDVAESTVLGYERRSN